MEKLSNDEMMSVMNIKISTVDEVKEFVNVAVSIPCDVTLVSGRYAIDGKSIMGVFSLSLEKPVTLQVANGKYAVYFRKWAVNEV